jgi:hypothetical protein
LPGLVFGATEVGDEWGSVRSILLEAFRLTQLAVGDSEPVVYVIASDDLLGRNGPGSAAVAAGLLSAARTAGIELAKSGLAINVLAIESDTSPEQAQQWVVRLLESGGPQGELIHLGADHLGKALG